MQSERRTTCVFFGHADTPTAIRPALKVAILSQLSKDPATEFLVGHQGSFDHMAYSILKEIKPCYPQMSFSVVLAYAPENRASDSANRYENTVLWDGVETTPKRYAIARRNSWLVQQCDMVICYVTRSAVSNSARYVEQASRKGKRIINLAEKNAL